MEDMGITKQQSRQVIESEPLKSDRVELIQNANRLAEIMMLKTTWPKMNSGFGPEVELSEVEERTYHAALEFLRQQFQSGAQTPDQVTKRNEVDSTVERTPPPAPVATGDAK